MNAHAQAFVEKKKKNSLMRQMQPKVNTLLNKRKKNANCKKRE